MKKQLGFTLLELMVVVAVIAILAALAITSYRNQLLKSKRAEAKQILSELALKQEKRRLNNATYTTVLAGTAVTGLQYAGGPGGSSTKTPSGYYNLAMTTPGATPVCPGSGATPSIGNSFRITATATGDQTADTACPSLVLTSRCGTVEKTPTSCW